MEQCWRLILDGRRQAALNMAVDEAILRACADGKAPPTLRLYGWEKPAVSLGYFQSVERARINIECCRESGIDLVRRPTGGRAVLHGHDITFSISVCEREIPSGFRSVPGSHLWLMRGAVAAFRLLDIPAEIGPAKGGRLRPTSNADCFAHIDRCDVRVGKEKAAGAAQVRKWGALLEQGSMPCVVPDIDAHRVFGVIGWISPPSIDLLAQIPLRTVKQAIVRGFEESLDVSFREGTLSDAEAGLALELERQKYGSADWTYQRGTSRVDKSMLDCYTGTVSLRGGR